MPRLRADPALAFVFIATIALAFKGVFAKFAYRNGLDVNALLLIRFGVAAPLFWFGVRVMTGGWAGSMGARDWRDCFLLGGLFFVATYCDFMALSMIDVGLSRLILFTFPAQIMVFSAILNRQPPSGRQLFAFVVTYGGLVLILAPDGFGRLAVKNTTGLCWAFICSTAYASYLMASQRIMKRIGSTRFTAASGSTTLVLMLITIPFTGGYGAMTFTPTGCWWGALIAVACTVLPFFLLFEGIARSNAARASLITLLGPAITIAAAWLLLEEVLSPTQLAGCALAVIGVGTVQGGFNNEKLETAPGAKGAKPLTA